MSDNIEKGEKLIQIKESDFSALMERVSKLETGNTSVKAEAPKHRTARVWYVNEDKTEILIGYGKNRTARRTDGSEFLEVELIYRNEKEEIKSKWVPYVDFRNEGNYDNAKIKSIKNNPKLIKRGSTRLKNVDYEKYRTTESDVTVDLEDVIANDTYELELPDGRVVEIHESALN